MAFEKGHKKFGGSVKGQTYKCTSALKACERMGYDPFEAMVKLAMEGDTKMIVELCQYIEPKKRAVEHSSDPEKGFRIILEDYRSKS